MHDLEQAADRIRRRALDARRAALAQPGICNQLVADCWQAIAEAARELAPPLHDKIRRPRWKQPPLWPDPPQPPTSPRPSRPSPC